MEKAIEMQAFEKINIGEVCRSCFERCDQYKMLYEEAESTEKRTLGDVFFDVVKIEIKTNVEPSPSRICLACSRDLINAYNFIQKSKQNNDRFQEYLKNAGLKQDCLSEFPIDIPNDANTADCLQIKVENEAINDYVDSMPEDKISPESSSESAESSDYEEPLHKKEKINKMQCPYCDRIFKRQDFLENHKRKHEEEIKKKEEAGEETSTFVCDECGLNFCSKADFEAHQIDVHPASIDDYSSTSWQSTSKAVLKFDNSLPLILQRNYFIVVDQRKTTRHQQVSNGVLALCQVCKRKISGSIKVTSNFLQHLKHKHPELYRKYLQEKSWNQTPSKTKNRQSIFDHKVLTFVVETNSPFSIVEHPAFVDLFKGTYLEVKPQRDISDLLSKKYVDMVAALKSTISKTEYVCCTADIWAVRQRSFFGYTCHWIGSDYKRKSAALACRRFNGTKNYHKIPDIICSINDQFGISEKQLVHTITENGSNFLRAFQEFGSIESHDEVDSEEESEVEDHKLPDCAPFLPYYAKHLRCVSQTLHLVATFDFLEALRRVPASYDKHLQAMKKCSQIWSKYSCPIKAEKVKGILTVSLEPPVVTRWNSLYDAIKNIIQSSSKLPIIANILCAEDLDPSELEYLEEYCQFMKPIAEGIEFLQKEDDIYFGYLIPILLTIKQKLKKFSLSPGAKYLKLVSNCMIESLINRFRPYFELQPSSHEAVIAAITCPNIKISNQAKLMQIWRESAEHCSVEYLEKLFLNEVNSSSLTADLCQPKKHTTGLKAHPFFSLEDSDEDESVQANTKENKVIRRDLKTFLKNEDNSPSSLEKHPVVKQMFYKFNTALPSSAPVERLLSFSELLEHHRRQNLTDEDFEKIVLVKTNKFMK